MINCQTFLQKLAGPGVQKHGCMLALHNQNIMCVNEHFSSGKFEGGESTLGRKKEKGEFPLSKQLQKWWKMGVWV